MAALHAGLAFALIRDLIATLRVRRGTPLVLATLVQQARVEALTMALSVVLHGADKPGAPRWTDARPPA